MTQLQVSTGLLESLLHISSVGALIVGCTYHDTYVVLEIEALDKTKPLPEGLVSLQVTKSIDTKLVSA